MEKDRQRQLMEVLSEAQADVANGEEISTEFSRILFPPERKEYELTYFGKESEQSIISETFAAPIQLDRTFGNKSMDSWINKIIFGDNLQVLKTLIEWKKEGLLKNADGTNGVRVVYIDPPFASKQDFKNRNERAYTDKLKGAQFLEWLRKRLILLREVLADDGTIFVHLDWHKSHYIKVLLDEIFGESNFLNEIIWAYTGPSRSKKFFPRKHDVIYSYQRESHIFNLDSAKVPYKKSKTGTSSNGIFGTDFTLDEKGKVIEDYWTDISPVGRLKDERTGYPTQKPEKLLSRMIATSSNKGDIILDVFGGSGTTAAVSEKLERRWITADVGKLSIYTIQKRILEIKGYKKFGVFNAGHYDESKLNNFTPSEWKKFAMALYNVEPYTQIINGFVFDGLKDGDPVKVFSPQELGQHIKITEETLTDIYQRLSSSTGSSEIFIIAPQGKFGFAVDEFDNEGQWNIMFNILRVPYSMNQNFTENFSAIKQANDSDSVNDAIDAVGFDFIRPPKVNYTVSNQKLTINSFEAFSRIRGAYKKNGFESFSMLLVDFCYDGQTFKMDKVFFQKDFGPNKTIDFDIKNKPEKIMLIFIDKFGNEFKTLRSEISDL